MEGVCKEWEGMCRGEGARVETQATVLKVQQNGPGLYKFEKFPTTVLSGLVLLAYIRCKILLFGTELHCAPLDIVP